MDYNKGYKIQFKSFLKWNADLQIAWMDTVIGYLQEKYWTR